MSAPSVPSPRRSYSDTMWNTYITEAIQSGNHKQYCTQHNIPYTTFKRKYNDYKKANNKENWSPNSKRRYRHRVFTDSTEKAAVEQLTEQYINQQKACNNSDLADCLLSIHNNKNTVKRCLFVSNSTITRIKQQYKRKSYNKSTVDDSVISTFQQKLIDTLNDVMNSDQTRIQQSMPPVCTIHQAGKPSKT